MDHSFCYLMLVPIQVPQGVTDDTHMFLYIILSHGIWKATFCRDCTPPGRNDSNTLSVIHANSQKTGSDVLQNMASA